MKKTRKFSDLPPLDLSSEKINIKSMSPEEAKEEMKKMIKIIKESKSILEDYSKNDGRFNASIL